jgi:serine/threonine-protein kinase HipA
MTVELVTLLGDDEIGRLRRDKSGRLSFTYHDSWRETRNAIPLSLSMPLTQAEHPHRLVSAYLWGLLPDNDIILERWARKFHVSLRNPFALIAKVGEDCAGAVRFVDEVRLEQLRVESTSRVEWLDEAGVADRLRTLTRDVSAWRSAADVGQFSLAGAQPKTALLFDGARWGVPSGRVATTHILKPGVAGLDGHAENEHFCLALARELGLSAVSSEVRRFEDQVAIVVERYDRIRVDDEVVRAHQEDLCQALGVHPSIKYENECGPGAPEIVALLTQHSQRRDEDVQRFVDALALNWLIGGTDGHAKNYSVLIGSAGRIRLAPIYDVASALPYQELQFQKLKLAMKIGGKYRLRDVGVHQWSKLFAELGVDADATFARIRTMAESLPDLAIDQKTRCERQGLTGPTLERLTNELCARATSLASFLDQSTSAS